MELGRFNVLIGENGCGKTNILEAISLGAAAASDKLDHEFLSSRGIRMADPDMLRSAFPVENPSKTIEVGFTTHGGAKLSYRLTSTGEPYAKWTSEPDVIFPKLVAISNPAAIMKNAAITKSAAIAHPVTITSEVPVTESESASVSNAIDILQKLNPAIKDLDSVIKACTETNGLDAVTSRLREVASRLHENRNNLLRTLVPIYPGSEILDFILYSPENSALRVFEMDGQIQPLGIRGEGLFKLLRVFSQREGQPELKKLNELLCLIDWFEDFQIPDDLSNGQRLIALKDRFMAPQSGRLDQRNANEGFLYLLFYFALFLSPETPAFFAIDNLDASLNPKLGSMLVQRLVELSKEHGKQVIVTTHNPALLDGLNLNDPDQRLMVVSRGRKGVTRVRRVDPPQPVEGEEPVRLSEAFLRGYLGGLPSNF